MCDFETHPVGTAKRLEELEQYARRASNAMDWAAGAGQTATMTVAGQKLVDPGAFIATDSWRKHPASKLEAAL